MVRIKVNLKQSVEEKKNLLYPECDPVEKCPEWKNRANRRVYLKLNKIKNIL
jgi:OOP family OmpA-OmpF porin